jgi:hypothetical protein
MGAEFMDFIYKHFFFYLFSGPLGFSEMLKNKWVATGDASPMFAPFLNIFHLFTGEEMISPINKLRVVITPNYVGTNVFTFFGTMYFYLGKVNGIIFTFVIGLSYYSLYFLGILLRKNWLIITVFILLTLLAFGWFEYYLYHLMVIEIPVFCLLMSICLEKKVKKSQPNVYL